MKKGYKILLYVLLGLIVIQFIPVDRVNPPVDSKLNFVEINKTPQDVQQLLKNACYDCHSYETKYPNYAYVAPISWSVKSHVNDGRKHANFSVWGKYSDDLKRDVLQKSIEELDSQEMPLAGYVVYHDEAKLSSADRKKLIDYFDSILKEMERTK